MVERKEHWENIYNTKQPNEVSWTQAKPQTSIDFIEGFNLPKSASIMDVGGGDSNLVDFLLDLGYENITVLDISGKALERAKTRLGDKANNVTWIESDITEFNSSEKYDIWHDRAVFHFLTSNEDIFTYVNLVNNTVNKNMVIGTFSTNGPLKCSGIEISQYDEESMTDLFNKNFRKMNCLLEDHTTPFDTQQNFIFCSFSKK